MRLHSKINSVLATLTLVIGLGVVVAACTDDADTASYNVSKAADNFEVVRRVVFVNGITNQYLLEMIGLCSIRADRADSQLEVICKEGPGEYKKHFLGISDNVFYLVEQLEVTKASAYHTRITFKPQAIVPNVDFRGDAGELLRHEDASD